MPSRDGGGDRAEGNSDEVDRGEVMIVQAKGYVAESVGVKVQTRCRLRPSPLPETLPTTCRPSHSPMAIYLAAHTQTLQTLWDSMAVAPSTRVGAARSR